HRAWNAWQVTLQFRIAVNPMFGIFLLDCRGFRCVGDLTIALHHAERSGNATSRTERKHRRRGHLGVRVGIHALLHHCSRTRFVRLQVPVRFVVGLPDTAEVGLAVGTYLVNGLLSSPVSANPKANPPHPAVHIVAGLDPRPCAKARSAARAPASNAVMPKFPSWHRGSL